MSDALSDKDYFDEAGEEAAPSENLITDPMVKKATFLIHKLANQKEQDYKDIQKKCRSLFKYENLAKVTLKDGHKIIEELIKRTGGEEEKPSEGARVTADKTEHKEIEKEETGKNKELESELGKLATMLKICVANSREIVSEELGKENITEGTQAVLVKSFAATLFIEASRRGLGR